MSSYGYHGGDETEPRIDALDLIEGMLQDGLSFSSLRRIVRARGPNFWIGATIGAATVVIVTKPEVRATLASFFRPGSSSTNPPTPAAASASSTDQPASTPGT